MLLFVCLCVCVCGGGGGVDKILNVFAVSFDLFNASLLNKNSILFLKHYLTQVFFKSS